MRCPPNLTPAPTLTRTQGGAATNTTIATISDLETAVYFSTISYAGIGFDDRYIDPAWRLVSAIEVVNGLLLLGWSTAFFVNVVAKLGRPS